MQPVIAFCGISYAAFCLCGNNESACLRNFKRELSVSIAFGSLNRELEIREIESSRVINAIKEIVLKLIVRVLLYCWDQSVYRIASE